MVRFRFFACWISECWFVRFGWFVLLRDQAFKMVFWFASLVVWHGIVLVELVCCCWAGIARCVYDWFLGGCFDFWDFVFGFGLAR